MSQRNTTDQITEQNTRSEFTKPALQNKKSFRLQSGSNVIVDGRHSYLNKYDFKQRIDSMFDETRSAILESENVQRNKRIFRAVQSECGAEPSNIIRNRSNSLEKRSAIEVSEEIRVKNTVQARIEKMFADVSSSEIEDDPGSPTVHRFQVDHIGSLPLFSKITSLQGLQEPLKNLYFNYRKRKFPSSKLQALLEISSLGLKVQNFEQNCHTVKEQVNPFPSIAVWAALKFVCRPQESASMMKGNSGLEYAFLPIVLDQKDSEKSSLFRPLDQNDIACAIERTYDDHSPLFVVIMRQNGTSNNRLLCHGFACATSEDAIILAANLYKALVATMNRSHNTNINDNGSLKKRKKVKCRNGLGTVCSVAGSSICGEGESDYLPPQKNNENVPTGNDKPQPTKKIPPPRPQRKNKNMNDFSNVVNSNDNISKINFESDEIITIEDMTLRQEENLSDNKTAGGSHDVKNVRNEEISPYQRQQDNTTKNASVCSRRSSISDKIESGDILTKVVIPRSGSFLHASGPLTSRYNRCVSDRGCGINSKNRKNSIHSPLGFIELFNELRIHEGLNNIDEILNTIIDVDGMSFNSLKPIYKEFIFKLAVTLTKDELYQRSKSIMQKQKRRKRQLTHHRRRRAFVSGYKIKRAFSISVSKLKSTTKFKIGLPFTSHVFPTIKKMQQNKPQHKTKMKLRRYNGPASTLSLTSRDSFETLLGLKGKGSGNQTDLDLELTSDDFYKGEILFHRKKLLTGTCTRVQNMTMMFQPAELLNNSSPNRDTHSPGFDRKKIEKSRRRRNHRQNTSGYISCSECSYNSESCKYKSSRKCYCSMQKEHSRYKGGQRQGVDNTSERLHPSSVSSCSCDTESCIESEKCYCNSSKKPSIFEQLRRQGFAASESSLSRPSSPITSRNTNNNEELCEKKGKTCLQASKSLEFFHVQKNTSESQLIYNENRGSSIQNTRKVYEGSQQSFNPTIVKQSYPTDVSTNLRTSQTNINKSALDDEGDSSSEDEINQENNNNYFPFAKLEDGFSYNCVDSYKRNDEDNHSYYRKHSVTDASEKLSTGRHNDVHEHNKILVVSTRDQKGQIKNSVTPLYHKGSKFPLKFLKSENIHEADAISIKKTAEIAALFSDMKVEKKNHINIRCSKDIIYNSLNPSDGFLCSRKSNRPIKEINLENSLGYFP